MTAMTNHKKATITTPSPAPRISPAKPPAPNLNGQIQQRAFELYRARIANGVPGDAVSDWLKAERELSGQPSTERIEFKARARGETLLRTSED